MKKEEKMTLYKDVAFEAHERWRLTRLKSDGTYDPRWKTIKDQKFIENLNGKELPSYIRKNENGYEIDIANASYNQLSPDWQKENDEGAKVAADIVLGGKILTEDEIGDIIHNAWLERNSWAKDGPLGVPYSELEKDEQEKDLEFYYIALTMNNATLMESTSKKLLGAIEDLERYKKLNLNVVIDWNGQNLYSEFDTIDTCYLKVLDMTYDQWRALKAKVNSKMEKETLKPKSKIPEYRKRGEALIYPERLTNWNNCMDNADADGPYSIDIVVNAVEVMEALDQGKTIEEATEIAENGNHSGYSWSRMMNVVTRFSKRGPAFYRANHEIIDPKSEKILQEIEAENRSFAEAEKSNLTRNKK